MARSEDAPVGGEGPGPRPTRLWNIEEASERLPALRELFRELRGWVARLRTIRTEQDRLSAFWGKEVDASDNPDRALRERLGTEAESLTRKLEREIAELQEQGIEVKDIDTGLVDLYSMLDGEVVFLCWKEGEEEISYFHTLSGGFRGRRPLPRRPARATGPAGSAG